MRIHNKTIINTRIKCVICKKKKMITVHKIKNNNSFIRFFLYTYNTAKETVYKRPFIEIYFHLNS